MYREAVYRASEAGVRIVAQTVIWDCKGNDATAAWDITLPTNLKDSADTF